MHAPIRLEYRIGAGTRAVALPAGHRRGEAPRPALPRVREGLRAAARLVPDLTACRPTKRSSCRDRGTVTTFCVVNIPFAGQSRRGARTCRASGAARRRRHRRCSASSRTCPANEVRMGLRVRGGVGGRDELDAQPRKHQVLPSRPASPTPTTTPTRDTSDARRRRRRLRAVEPTCRRSTAATRSRSSCRSSPRRSSRLGIDRGRHRLHRARAAATTCAGRPFSFVTALDARRRVAADRRVARRDGRRLGALRGVGAAPARRRRHRARLRLRQVVARRPPRGARRCSSTRTTSTPLWPDAVSLAALQARACLEASGTSERDLAEVAVRSRGGGEVEPERAASPATRRSTRCSPSRTSISPLRAARLPADLRRRRRDRARGRRPGAQGRERPAGVDPRHRPPHRAARARRARPHARRRRRGIAAEKAGVADGTVDVAELHAPFTHQELDPARRARARRRRGREPVGRRARRQPDDGRRAHPHRRGGRAGDGAATPAARVAHATLGPVPAAEPRLRVMEG